MLYLTLGEGWSGVLSSQVADACRFLERASGRDVRLVAFASLRRYASERERFLAAHARTTVLPMFPRLGNWRANHPLLWLAVRRSGERSVVARNALAAQLALRLRDAGLVDSVCLDARGALSAEWREYDVVHDASLRHDIAGLERDAVLRSDFRIAVSHALVRWWREELGYASDRHVVVPCTVGRDFEGALPDAASRAAVRARHGFGPGDVVLVFAGAAAGWQSFSLIDDLLRATLAADARVKALVLANVPASSLKASAAFPDRVRFGWVPHGEMFTTLAACDHGILLREPSVTNRVAAPTKLAEYLAAGLGVIVSPGIGDYSDFVAREGCGVVVAQPGRGVEVEPPTERQRERHHELAMRHFTKRAHEAAYRRVLEAMGEPAAAPRGSVA